MTGVKVDCFKCRHFYVTWDPDFPRGCRAMNFRTRGIPSLDVRRAVGHECLNFLDKRGKEEKK